MGRTIQVEKKMLIKQWDVPRVERNFRLGQLLCIRWRILGVGVALLIGVAGGGMVRNRSASRNVLQASLPAQMTLTAGYRAFVFTPSAGGH